MKRSVKNAPKTSRTGTGKTGGQQKNVHRYARIRNRFGTDYINACLAQRYGQEDSCTTALALIDAYHSAQKSFFRQKEDSYVHHAKK